MAAPPIGIHQRLALARTGELRLGSLISVISTSEMRYEGILFEISNYRLGLKYVKFFGSEGRLKYGPQIPGKDRIYNFIYLRGANIKDLQVISPPLPPTRSAVPGHPAIIRPRFRHPTPTHMASTSHGASVRSSARPILRPGTSFQLNQPRPRDLSASTSSFRGSFLPPPPANISRPRPAYWPGLIGSSRGVAYFHPPPSQAPVQQQQNVNTSVAGGSSYYEHQHPLLLGHSTGRSQTTNPSLLSGGQVTFCSPQVQQSGQRQTVNIEEMTAIAPAMEALPSKSSEETLEKPKTETGSTSSPHDKNQSAGGRDQKPRVIRRFVEDFDFEGMYKKFNKKEVWAIFSNSDDHKLPVYHKDDFFDYLSYGLPEHESILTLSQQMKIDNETFGVEIPIVHIDHGNRPRSSRTSQASLGGRRYGNVRGGPGKKVWRRVSK